MEARDSRFRTRSMNEGKPVVRPIGPPLLHPGGISAYALSDDATIAVLGGHDGNVRLWDPATGNPIGPPLSHPAPIVALAFHPTKWAMLVSCEDKTIHLWNLPRSVSGEAERVALWVQVISGMELDSEMGAHLLDAPSHERLRQRLEALGGPP